MSAPVVADKRYHKGANPRQLFFDGGDILNGFGRKDSSNKKYKLNILTRVTVGMILNLFAVLSLLCLITNNLVFGSVGVAVSSFMLGVFGWCAYLVDVVLIIGGIELVKGVRAKISLFDKTTISLIVIFLVFLLNAITIKEVGSYGEFLKSAYYRGGEGFKKATAGGVIVSIFDWLFCKAITRTGTYVLYSLFFAICVALLIAYHAGLIAVSEKERTKRNKKKFKNVKGSREYPVDNVEFPDLNDNGESVNGLYYREDDFKESDPRRRKNEDRRTVLRYAQGSSGLILATADSLRDKETEEAKRKLDYIKTPYEILSDDNRKETKRDTDVRVKEEKKEDKPKVTELKRDGEYDAEDYYEGITHYGDAETSVRSDTASELDANKYYDLRSDDAPKTRTENATANEQPPKRYDETPIKRYDETDDADSSENVAAFGRGNVDNVQSPETKRGGAFGFDSDESQPPETKRGGAFGFDSNESVRPREAPHSETFGFNADDNSLSTKTERAGSEFIDDFGDMFDLTEDNFDEKKERKEELPSTNVRRSGRRDSANVTPESSGLLDFGDTNKRREVEEEPKLIVVPDKEEEPKFVMPVHIPYNKPSTAMFTEYPKSTGNDMTEQTEKTIIIENTLEGFNIPAKVVNIVKGPTVTRYELQMPQGISVNKVNGVANDLAMNLCAATGVIIEAPIPGKNLFGIQVENKNKVTVGLRDILESKEFSADGTGKLLYSIGKDIVGNIIVENLAKAPHLLVAGATGTGKSVCLNSLIISLICKYGPEDLRLILVDPKQVEFSMYAHLPHLLFDQILTDVQTTIATLDWLVNEMERRYASFSEAGVTDINMYNERIANDEVPKMVRIVVIVDELADFMATRKRDMEDRIQRLAAKARAAGIHLVLATQRPSVDVITGVIKANLPTRIACKVSSVVDAMTIFNESGAEKLLGNGDLLYKSSTMFNCERMQGSFVSNSEIHAAVKYIRENNTCYFDPKIMEQINNIAHPIVAERVENGKEETAKKESRVDELFDDAVRHVIKLKSASATNLQARFKIGYSTATRLLQQMVDEGIVSEYSGSKSRTVLMSLEEYEAKFGRGGEN